MKQLLDDNSDNSAAKKKLRTGGDAIILEVDRLYREEFIKRAKSQVDKWKGIPDEDFEDAFQEALIVFFKKLSTLGPEVNLAGFLWLTFLNKLKHAQRARNKLSFGTEVKDEMLQDWDDRIYRDIEQKHRKEMFKKAIAQTGNSCKKILILRFYRNFSGEAIAKRLGYKSAASVHAQTNRCIKKLEKIINEQL